MKAQWLGLNVIDMPTDLHRPPSKVDDEILRRSIEEGGVQQPIIVLRDGARFRVVDGGRRVKLAGVVGLERVPAVIAEVPSGEDSSEFARRLRFILDELRQDLMPSQRAGLIERLKAQFGMTNLAVSQYLGVDQDSITNWLALRRYIPEVVTAMDSGKLTMQAARAFDGMSEKGQRHVWKRHGRELAEGSGAAMHKQVRANYPPGEFRDFYVDADKIARRLARKLKGPRKVSPRPSFSPVEKRRLMTSLEFREAELKDAQDELRELKSEIAAATPLVAAILRQEKLRALVPEEMLPELERFAEVYC
jgi:ParB/RepB/Spo0J family partition protein